MGGISPCEVEGIPALGFDTGLDARAFAQTKSAQLIIQPGWIVTAEGRVESWKPGGVIEQGGTMVIWGPAFTGKRLDLLISEALQKDKALDALRYWIRGRIILGEAAGDIPVPWPVGALIDPQGNLLFPPDQLIYRTIESEGKDIWRTAAASWVHPDLTGDEAGAFAAGTMLYRIFCGAPPFPRQDSNLLMQDIREGVFFPPRLAAPGLDPRLAILITKAMTPLPRGSQKKIPEKGETTPLEALRDYVGPPGSASVESYVHTLSKEAQIKIRFEQEGFKKKQNLGVKTKRFLMRNTLLIGVISITLGILGLLGRAILEERSHAPTTKGMSPREVVETYYRSIGALDHTLMEACVMGKAGRGDIDMVTNYFVISRVQQAYAMNTPGLLPAQQWIDTGSPPTGAAIFGVSDLQLTGLDPDEGDGEVTFRASYLLWLPQTGGSLEAPKQGEAASPKPSGEEEAAPPMHTSLTDRVRLVLYKEAWRIAEIQREGTIP